MDDAFMLLVLRVEVLSELLLEAKVFTEEQFVEKWNVVVTEIQEQTLLQAEQDVQETS
ncbi:MAG: hypothetical protein F2801_04625 [Actinobacteria bacterium]|nr:hypothetical protein [Actinomycetota bacterium]